LDFDGDICAIVPEDTDIGALIVNAVRDIPYDIWEEAQVAKKVKFTYDMKALIEHLVKNAKVDRTGPITNHAMRSSEISNHFTQIARTCRRNGIDNVFFKEPWSFPEVDEKYGWYGDKYRGLLWKDNTGKQFMTVRGIAKCKKVGALWVWDKGPEAFVGWKSVTEIEEEAKKYMDKVKVLRLLQGREIDGAKTGVYAEGPEGRNDFTDEVKVITTPHQMLARRVILKKGESKSDNHNSFVSFSPLGDLYDYVQSRRHEIEDKLDNGINMTQYLFTLLTKDELRWFYARWNVTNPETNEVKDKSLLEIIEDHKKVYSQAWANARELPDEDRMTFGKKIKEEEHEWLLSLTNYTNTTNNNLPLTVIATAAYIVAYDKKNNQNTGLGYGWILASTLLDVFARGNNKRRLVRLPHKNVESAEIKDGWLYVNEMKHMKVNSVEGPVDVINVSGQNCAMLQKKVDNAASTAPFVFPGAIDANVLYSITASGLAYTQAENAVNWIDLVRANGGYFDIIMNSQKRVVMVINGEEIGFPIFNCSPLQSLHMLNKRVKVMNLDNPIDDKLVASTKTGKSVKDIWVAIA